jgi:hypothetical protein
MEIARLLLAIVLGVAGGLVIVGNWRVFLMGVRGERAPSWVPLIGGVLGSLSCWLAPSPWFNANWRVPLFIDWGSVPGLVHTLVWLIFLRSRDPESEQTARFTRVAACVIALCSVALAAVSVVVTPLK